ncbi:uncharacterized protein LOC124918208 [Impatiens glandulifera]|uniref:uncharacterized protein LOC124918208 n=1 Tax=Impatiens glandulifera TaxID=253017 RepID=UPI001FB0C66A|nr:uncharacterized protein LOC124918208 [Impatiens glandulifera]
MSSTTFATFPMIISSYSAGSNHRKSNQNRNKAPSSSTNSSRWWFPVFGWTAAADPSNKINNEESVGNDSEAADLSGSRFPPLGCFTEKKAKQLRRKTVEIASFHDVMYHSAIASRLASDSSDL